jgi:hypothetical protein
LAVLVDAAFGEQLLDVAKREVVAQIPAHRHHDHLGREAEARGRRAGRDQDKTQLRTSPVNPA